MTTYQESTDRDVREKAWRAVTDRRMRAVDEIDKVFDEQIKLRDTVAKNAGLASYVDYAFASMHRFDYTPKDCFSFHDAIEQAVMPFCAKLDASRKQQLGLDVLRPWDGAVDPLGRSPLKPFEGGKDLVDRSRIVFDKLDPELAGMFRDLGDGTNTNGIASGELLDLDSRKGKSPGGYQYMQDKSRKPFIFMNAAGVHRDVETMVHEAGHAFHSMLCIDEPLVSYRHSPIEFAEVASMSMELLTMPYWEAYYDKADADRARRQQIEGSLQTLTWIATIDAFQHWIYTNPTHTRDQRTAEWLRLEERFGSRGSRFDWTGLDHERANVWQRQPHLFGHPFYYVEYGIAQLGALQLWIKGLEDGEQAAIEAYKRALSLGGSKPLPELFDAANIHFRFDAELLGKLIGRVEQELAKLPE